MILSGVSLDILGREVYFIIGKEKRVWLVWEMLYNLD